MKPGESKFGILREPLGEVAAGTTVVVSREHALSADGIYFSYVISIPSVETYRLLSLDTINRLVEILE